MTKVIIDTDPGIDDAIALCYAIAHPGLDVIAMTSIFGNVSCELAADNALRLCELNQVKIPVARGATVPLEIKPNTPADFVHGVNGFGNIDIPIGSESPLDLSAAELIVEQVRLHPAEITIIAVGPLTNLALALQLAPDIASKVKEVIVMGGVFYRDGNVTAHAEANIWNDPHAAKSVLGADWPLVIHGLDITYQIAFDRSFFEQLANANPTVGSFLQDAAEFYIEFYMQQHNFAGCCPHDLLAIAYATNPHWFQCENAVFDVITSGEQIGKTLNVISDQKPHGLQNKRIALQVDKNALLADYLATLSL